MTSARPLARRRIVVAPDAFVEVVVWLLPAPIPPCEHHFKYRLAYVVSGQCVIRYDNERGKGDHRHIDDVEYTYDFLNQDKMIVDFLLDIKRWNDEHGRS